MKKLFFCFFAALTAASNVSALILYGADNSANTSAPASGAPFSNVVQVYTDGSLSGSAVYLGNGYFITANHVATNADTTSITFDGSSFFNIASYYAPTRVGDVDLKIFYVADARATSSLSPLEIYTKAFKTQVGITLVAGGVGRATTVEVGGNPIAWGGVDTADIRWGTNNIYGSGNANINGYTYDYYYTTLDSASGANEAALTLYDSGAAMFYKDIMGNWFLAGIATAVSTADMSAFSDTSLSLEGDPNFFVNLSSYAAEIGEMISKAPAVPEPADIALLFSSIVLGGILIARRRR